MCAGGLSLTDDRVEAHDAKSVNVSADGVGVEAVGAEGGRVGASVKLGRGGESASEESSDNEELHFDGCGLGVLRSKEVFESV